MVIRILHITDLHHTSRSVKNIGNWWDNSIRQLAGSGGFNAIVCSGDIGVAGQNLDENLKTGFEYLNELWRAASPEGAAEPSIPIIITPGNHDIERPPSQANDAERMERRFKLFIKHINNTLHGVNRKLLCLPKSLASGGIQSSCIIGDGAVAIFPLCSTTHSGEVPLKGRHAIESVISNSDMNDVDRRSILKLLDGLKVDIPFIHEDDIKNTQNDGSYKLGIAVSHHPLWPLPYAQDETVDFDVPVNGMRVVHSLSQKGINLLLHGHNHYMGCSLLYGSKIRVTGTLMQLGEMLSICGGHLKDPVSQHFGFQIIEIISDVGNRISLTVTDHTLEHPNGKKSARVFLEEREISSKKRHKPRWIHIEGLLADDAGSGFEFNRKWYLRQSISEELGIMALISKVEQRWTKNLTHLPKPAELSTYQITKSSSLDGVDKFIKNSIDNITDFTAGTRGVTSEFAAELLRRAQTGKTKVMIFIDYMGNGTWGRPELIANTAQLFRLYCEKNKSILNKTKGKRNWTHTLSYVEKGRVATGDPANANSKPLKFDLARILIWDKDALCTPSALVLIHLHRVFDVPLFFVDIDELDEDLKSSVKDVHFEWTSAKLHRNSKPDMCYPLDEKTGKRNVVSNNLRDSHWAIALDLAEYFKNTLNTANEEIKWLLNSGGIE